MLARPRLRPSIALLLLLAGCTSVPYADQPWIEVRTTNFWLISNAPEPVAVDVLSRLERFRSAARILTGAERLEPALPTRVFAFGDERSWSRFRLNAHTSGFFVTDMEANYLAVDASVGPEAGDVDVALHEYVHFITRNQASRIQYPTWYEEGFADAISTVRFEGPDGLVVGAVPPGRAAWLVRERWLPLDTIISARGYEGLSSRERAMFYAQSWLLVHRLTWGHVADLPPRNEEMETYLLRVGRGEPERRVFREVFGVEPAEMQEELRGYAKTVPLVRVKDEIPAIEPSHAGTRALTSREAWLHLCELQLARGADGAADAETLARRVLETAPDDARARVLLALAIVEQGREPDPALVRRALELDPENPVVLRGAGRIGLRQMQGAGDGESVPRSLATRTRDLYANAVAIDPYVPAAHAGLGYASLALDDPVAADRALREAFRLAPWDLNVALALGELHSRYGSPEEASVLLRLVAGAAHEDAMRQRARELLEGIEAGG